jgi:hypothetical protein
MRGAGFRWIAALIVIGLPFLLIYASGLPQWVGRAIGSGILCYAVTFLFSGYGLSPKTMMKFWRGPKTKTERREMSPRIARLVQILTAALALFFWWYWAIPFAMDVVTMARSHGPTRFTGQVSSVGGAIYGLNFLKRSVYFRDANGSAGRSSYTLLYSLEGIEPGGRYEVTVFPRSRMLLDAKEIQ